MRMFIDNNYLKWLEFSGIWNKKVYNLLVIVIMVFEMLI